MAEAKTADAPDTVETLPPPPDDRERAATSPLLEVIIRPIAEGPTVHVEAQVKIAPVQGGPGGAETAETRLDLSAPWKEHRFELGDSDTLTIKSSLVGVVRFDYPQSANISEGIDEKEVSDLKKRKADRIKAEEKAEKDRVAKEEKHRNTVATPSGAKAPEGGAVGGMRSTNELPGRNKDATPHK